MLNIRNRVKLLVYVAGALVLLVTTLDPDDPANIIRLDRLTYVEAGLLVLVAVFDRWLWRTRPFLRLLRTGPVISGTWTGDIDPSNSDGGAIRAFLAVGQTFSGLNIRLITAESSSDSTAVTISTRKDGLSTIEYLYRNIPRDSVRDRSPIHYGAVILEASGQTPSALDGSYFTSRRTTGEMHFSERKTKVAHSYAAAIELFG